MVSGPSGSGKSTLFRALAGIWPFGRDGSAPAGSAASSSCRSGRTSPSPPCERCSAIPVIRGRHGRRRAPQALGDGPAPAPVAGRLDEVATGRWSCRAASSSASPSRAPWCRIPTGSSSTKRPRRLDEASEARLYALLRERLPATTVVSVAHRPGVAAFHRRRLTLHPETRSSRTAWCRPPPAEPLVCHGSVRSGFWSRRGGGPFRGGRGIEATKKKSSSTSVTGRSGDAGGQHPNRRESSGRSVPGVRRKPA